MKKIKSSNLKKILIFDIIEISLAEQVTPVSLVCQ